MKERKEKKHTSKMNRKLNFVINYTKSKWVKYYLQWKTKKMKMKSKNLNLR